MLSSLLCCYNHLCIEMMQPHHHGLGCPAIVTSQSICSDDNIRQQEQVSAQTLTQQECFYLLLSSLPQLRVCFALNDDMSVERARHLILPASSSSNADETRERASLFRCTNTERVKRRLDRSVVSHLPSRRMQLPDPSRTPSNIRQLQGKHANGCLHQPEP